MNVTTNRVKRPFIHHALHGIGSGVAVCLLLSPCNAGAQDTSSVHPVRRDSILRHTPLEMVEVVYSRKQLAATGHRVQELDSALQSRFKFASIADLLGAGSSVFIRNYGPGAIAGTSLRGGNASQTAVLWNGLPIQNAMLGQTDLSLLSTALFNKVEVEYGSGSALWGSGAVGGSIHLGNALRFNNPSQVEAALSLGSFTKNSQVIHYSFGSKKWAASTRSYFTYSKNDYRFRFNNSDTSDVYRRNAASYRQGGILQDVQYAAGPHHLFKASAWFNAGLRSIPQFNNEVSAGTYQQDAAFRSSLQHVYTRGRYTAQNRVAYVQDKLHYTDSSLALYSHSKVHNVFLEQENFFKLRPHHQVNVSFLSVLSNAMADAYNGKQSMSKLAVVLGDAYQFKSVKAMMYTNLRAEYFSTGVLPITGSLAFEYSPWSGLKCLLHGARTYRQPTLNELYWQPGGNPNLKPETGYTAEGSIEYNKKLKHILLSVSASLYQRRMDHWIQWLPANNGMSSPANIQQVWSRGTDTQWGLSYRKQKWQFNVALSTAYVLSTVEKDLQTNSDALKKQLIYTPRYMANANAGLSYQSWTLNYRHSYVGYRFTTADNSAWLTPYHLGDLRLSTLLKAEDFSLSLFAGIQNVGNSTYTIMAGRPMPLRSYEAGIILHTNSKPKTKDQ